LTQAHRGRDHDEQMSARSQHAESVAPGQLIAGRFVIGRALGSGGMADVYEALDRAAGVSVALKLLRPEIADRKEAVERLRREAEVLRTLDHPGIVRLETFGALDDGRIFFAMELLRGETLGERMRREGPLAPVDLAPILRVACDALDAAHARGIVHRDLKPDNLFLHRGDKGPSVKVLDFGISKVHGGDKLTVTGEVLGTPRYMAPEQLSAERDLDARTDVYAMGILLYEALAGHPPFLAATATDLLVAILNGKSAPLRSFRPDLSAEVEAVVARAMARAREARYVSAGELADAFDAVVPRRSAETVLEARAGMSTVALGSMAAVDASRLGIVNRADSADPNAAAPGTFSTFSAPPDPVPAPIVPQASLAPIPAVHTAVERPSMQRPPPRPSRPSRMSRPSATPRRKKSNRWLLVVVGVLAGASSAAIAIGALKFLESRDRAGDDDGSAEAQITAPDPEAPVAIDETADAGALDAGVEIGELPQGEEPPPLEPDPEPPPESESTSSMRTKTRRVERANESPPGEPTTPTEMIREARAALGRGDTTRCLELVDRAIHNGGGSTALRLQGDCYLRANNRSDAVKAYERFCQLAPDHPAIEEVRRLTESLGGRCP
jgi:serine/threonine protein kinase